MQEDKSKTSFVSVHLPGYESGPSRNVVRFRHGLVCKRLSRMTSRRGTPRYVLTDNGTNFDGDEREIHELVHALDRNKIIEDTPVHHPIKWKFNPPSAPHFGGVFEAMVKSAKRAMKAILGNAEITDEELLTAICGAKYLLNPRSTICRIFLWCAVALEFMNMRLDLILFGLGKGERVVNF